jgi:hypothetical protein
VGEGFVGGPGARRLAGDSPSRHPGRRQNHLHPPFASGHGGFGPHQKPEFYRFNDPAEWEDAGFRDLFAGPGLKLVEWPQQAGDLLPPADAELHLTLQGEATDMGATEDPRQVKVLARSPAGQTLIDAWHQPAQQEAHHV